MSNVYGDSCTPNLGGVSNFYTIEQINNLLKAKPNSSQVYTRSYLDNEFTEIQNALGSLSTSSITQQDLSESLDSLESSILNEVSGLYALSSDVYTQTEIDEKISDLNIDPDGFVKTSPTNLQDNVIYPDSLNIPALTLRGSSTNPYVQKWLSNNSDVIGSISNDGSVVFERSLEIGRLVSNGETALNLNLKRISNLGNPVANKDAVNLSYLREYIVGFFDVGDSTNSGITDYIDSAIASHVEDLDPHVQYEKIGNLGTAAYTDSSEYATSAQGDLADSSIQPGDPALSDAREWTAETISESEARQGEDTTRRAFTAQRARQSAEGWWSSSQDKIASSVIDTTDIESFSRLCVQLGTRAFGIGVPGSKLFGTGPVAYGDFPLAITIADYFPVDPASGSFV
jgi:hypothetical protein